MLRRSFAMVGLWLLLSAPLLAQDAKPTAAQEIPPPLRDWQAWVLHDVPQHDCPVLFNQFVAHQQPADGSYVCVWPGRLTLDADKDGAHFNLVVHVDAAGWVALPGDNRAWPQQVTANNQSAVVLEHGGVPSLRLAAGDYQLRGVLPWSTRPAHIRVPPQIGLITLSVDGAAVTRIERHDDQLTLGEAVAAQRATDALQLRVYRQLQDGLPAMLETRLQLNVAGGAREQLFGPVLPEGFVAAALSGDLPARLESDGRLRVQLRPGQWTVTLSARSVTALSKITLKAQPAPWPQREIWSYQDNTDLRSTRIEGNAIDAAQAGVPQDWNDEPAYTLDASSGLSIEQGTRGDEGGRGDQLRLQRELWLDFNGAGLSVADQLSGDLLHHQRLDVSAPWQLQRASQSGSPLLITKGDHGDSGIELRDRKLNLSAGLRLPMHGGSMPSSGWQVPMERIDANLHLPYGYRLLGAVGADVSPDSWVGQWSLLDLFVLALIALLAGRLLGWPWALLAAAYLALAQHENQAPLWTLAVVLALALVLRALPEGRLRSSAQIIAIAVLALTVLWTLPFAATQLEYALHPQLEGAQRSGVVADNFAEPAEAKERVYAQAVIPPPPVEEVSQDATPPAPPAPPAPTAEQPIALQSPGFMRSAAPANAGGQNLSSVMVTAENLPSYAIQTQDSRSVIQAGAGMPQWDEGNNYRLGWSGPVTAEQSTHLVIAPAWLVRLLRVLLVGLLATLLARLAQRLLSPWRTGWSWRGGSVASVALLALALLPHGVHAQNAPAQPLPSQALLDQLRNRLTEAPTCAPSCTTIAQAQLQTGNDTLDVLLETHVGAAVSMPLPTSDGVLQLTDVSVDGHADAPVSRMGEQLWVRLERGVHQLRLHYRIGTADSTSLSFSERPQRVLFSGSGWSLDGVDEGRPLGDSIALHRVRAAGTGKELTTTQDFPPYVRLTRRLLLGLDWTVQNTVERIAPEEGGFSTTLPLLPGEHPLGDDVLVKDGRISVTFNANLSEVSWTSRLDHAAALALQAPALGDRAEVWEIHASPMWHVEAKGVPTSAGGEGLRFDPLPGETLQLALTQPPPVAGDSLAFDSMQVSSAVGERASETTVMLRSRSTRGGEHAIDLRAGAELLDARRDDESLSLAVRDNKLSLPLLPGSHVYTLRLREPHGVAAHLSTPAFALHAPVANIGMELHLPQDRWVLWTWGPTDGPAVLYWSQLLVLLLAAWLLGRFAPTPLRFYQWLLLGLGFSAFAWSAYALVVAWLILFGWRARLNASERWPVARFNLLQAGLAALTLVALAVLVSAVPKGLLGLPDMHVAGNDSSAWNLRWFADQSANALPMGGVLSVSLWVYKIAMLLWALWLASALIGWLRWMFDAWTRSGYWRKGEPRVVAPPQLPTSGEAEPPHA